MNFKQHTGKSITIAFRKFNKQNPHVYVYFKRYTKQLARSGQKLTSSKMIINRIRWEIYMENKGSDKYRINDAFTSRYARKFIRDFPKYKNVFHLRELRS